MVKTTMLVCLAVLLSSAFAIPTDTQIEIMRSARNADIQAYFSWSGVVLSDTPIISPFFACVRAYNYKGVVTGALMVDRVDCQSNSYYKQAWNGIQMCNSNNMNGKLYIDASLGYPVSYSCS
jgi:hypothetical protein